MGVVSLEDARGGCSDYAEEIFWGRFMGMVEV